MIGPIEINDYDPSDNPLGAIPPGALENFLGTARGSVTNGRGVMDDNRNVIPEPDLIKWAKWMGKYDRTIGRTEIAGYLVSTVFLGLDHGFGGTPLWFETMVSDATKSKSKNLAERGVDLFMARYPDAALARAGHAEVVQRIQDGWVPGQDDTEKPN